MNPTWKGKPLFDFREPSASARPDERAYSTKTKVLTFAFAKPSMLERTMSKQAMPPWSSPPEHDHRTRIGIEAMAKPIVER